MGEERQAAEAAQRLWALRNENDRLRAELAAERERGKTAWEAGRDAVCDLADITAGEGDANPELPETIAMAYDNGVRSALKVLAKHGRSLTPPSEPGSTP